MEIVYARQQIPDLRNQQLERSLFLAGPTPRNHEVSSWRPEALQILAEQKFGGLVFVPEDPDGSFDESVNESEQISWEAMGLRYARCIMFWIPRELPSMPGFTTNIEFGRYMDSGKVVLGAPANAIKMGYMKYWAMVLGIPYSRTLEQTIMNALKMLDSC